MVRKTYKIWKIGDMLEELSEKGIPTKEVRRPPKALWEKAKKVV